MSRDKKLERFVSNMGIKDVMSIRVSKEIRQLITELAACSEGLSQGEVIEAALLKAFKEGLLCSSSDQKRISSMLNREIQKNLTTF